jgi:uncharacterized membrane protein YphA (DoxX/SURF4 family)
MFPGGSSATGLLLLRAAIGLIAALQGWAYFAWRESPKLGMLAVGILTLLSGIVLIVGLWTVIGSAIIACSAIGTAFAWLPAPRPNLFDTALSTGLVIVVAVAIALLGPGALSIDARRFGFREIIIPRTPRHPNA